MSDRDQYRLSDFTLVEPLVNKWAAWSHLISPVPCSFHLKNFQIELLKSYLSDPQVHTQACLDPKMRSGRFVAIPAKRAPEVRSFLADSEIKLRDNLALAQQTIGFHNYLIQEARGKSLDSYYEKLPPELSGYVELLYDYYHRPTVRFFESLLYRSKYYKKDLQSLRLSLHTRDSDRPFLLNTPRLLEANQIDWSVSFENDQVDELFRLGASPKPLGYIRELLGLSLADDQQLRALLSADPHVRPERWTGPGTRLRYFGHACVLIEWGGKAILTDPCIGVSPSEGGMNRLTYKDLPEKIDFVLVTHNHHDHFCLETLLRLRHRLECLIVPRSSGIFYGDLSLGLLAKQIGFKQVIELDALDSIELPEGEIIAIPFMGEHADLPHGKAAYVVRARDQQMLFAADSDCLDEEMYRHIFRILGPIQTVFIGLECVGAPLSWTGGAFLPAEPEFGIDQSRRYKGADSARAMKILEAIQAERLYVYAMGLEPWLEYMLGLAYSDEAVQLQEARKLLRRARRKNFSEAELLNGTCELHLSPLSRRGGVVLRPESRKCEDDSLSRAIRSCEADRGFPLSYAQRRLWDLAKAEVNDSECEIDATVRLTGSLNIAALGQALNEIIRRHEILRATFVSSGGEPVQLILPVLSLPLWLMDFSCFSEPGAESVRRCCTGEGEKCGLALIRGPLIQCRLARLSAQEHVLHSRMHQIIFDRWSWDILIAELMALYQAFLTGYPSPLTEPTIQYSDFVAWQRQWLDEEMSEDQLSYWKQRLSGKRLQMDLGLEPESPTGQHCQQGVQSFTLSEALTQALRELSQQEDISLFVTLLAAFQALLHCYTGEDHIIVETQVSNRNQAGAKNMIGCFINTLALLTNVSGNPTFRELLGRVQGVTVEAMAHQDLPFDVLRKQLTTGGEKNCELISSVLFAQESAWNCPLQLPGLSLTEASIETAFRPADLALLMIEEKKRIVGTWSYNQIRYEANSMAEFTKRFVAILEMVSTHPERRILDILSVQEEQDGDAWIVSVVQSVIKAEDGFRFG